MSIAMPVSPRQAAARLGLSVGRVRQLIASGALRAVDIGLDRPLWAIDETELERFVALTRPSHRPRKDRAMDCEPIKAGTATDFSGAEYTIEELPATANEGDTCQICWPGGSGWYQTWYVWHDGAWTEEGSTAPWQMSIG